MKPVQNTIQQVDELPAIEEIAFGIGDPRWVMRTQAELYSDVTTAIIREYSTNAWDAHVMAGHTDPIEVTLPSALNPFFVVKDHGVGMDRDVFRRIYTQFGVSDKRERNDANGQLGYGSKSGIAYTNSFEVTSVKDGIKTHGIIQRKPDWSIVLKVVAESPTTERNGTTITIPVNNHQEFVHKANEFYKFWLPGRVLLNGKETKQAVGKKIADNLYYSESYGQSYVVMSNVAYRIANPDVLFRKSGMNPIHFVAYVDDFSAKYGQAAVEFTPSREDLKYTDHTKATLQRVIDDFAKNIVKNAQKEIDGAKDHFGAYMAWSNWCSILGRGMFAELKFDGDKFENKFAITAKRYQVGNYRYSTYSINEWEVGNMDRTLIVTEFSNEVSSNAKAKARAYAQQIGLNPSWILFTAQESKDIKSVWINRDNFVDWEALKKALPKKAPKPRLYASGPQRIAGSFDFFTSKGRKDEQSVPSTGQVFYITVKDEKDYDVPYVLRLLNQNDTTVILLSANRLAKFKREYPHVPEFLTYAKTKVVMDGVTLLSADAKTALDVRAELRQWFNKIPVQDVKDPEWVRVYGLTKNVDTLTKAYDENRALASALRLVYNVKVYKSTVKDFGFFKKYPLLSMSPYYYNGSGADLAIYINAVHAAS
jgi:hypothetical protein